MVELRTTTSFSPSSDSARAAMEVNTQCVTDKASLARAGHDNEHCFSGGPRV
jgi:hypothetical protein